METQESDLTHWEYLHNSAESPNSVQPNLTDTQDHDYSDGIIRADYFSADSQTRYATRTAASSEAGSGSVESDNPSWIDPDLQENLVYGKETCELWSDSGSDDRSDDRRIELGFVGSEGSQVGFGGIGELGFVGNEDSRVGFEESRSFDGRYELGFAGNEDSQVGFGGVGERSGEFEEFGNSGFDGVGDRGSGTGGVGLGESVSEFGSFSVRDELGFVGESRVGCEEDLDRIERKDLVEEASVKSDGLSGQVEDKGESNVTTKDNVRPAKEVEKRSVVWWKGPLEFLKYCVFRVSPVWSLSVAAAMVGFAILGRRLYRMKRKSRGLEIKVAVDDKRVSQFMSRAARLNEAFSVVKRVPIVRPLLPGPGIASWPVISLR